jgi:hypothetical protein
LEGPELPIQLADNSDVDGEEIPCPTPTSELATTEEDPRSSPSSANPVASRAAPQSSLLMRKKSATNAVIAAGKKIKKPSNTDKVITVLNDIRADMKETREAFSRDHVQEQAGTVLMKEFKDLPLSDKVLLIDAFESIGKSRLFLAAKGEVREEWVRTNLAKIKASNGETEAAQEGEDY